MSETAERPEFKNREEEVEFGDDAEVYVDMEFGGHCNRCDADLVEDTSSFGRLRCPSCGVVYGPTVHYAEVDHDDGVAAEEDEEWPMERPGMDVEDGLLTIFVRYRGQCWCGGEETRMRANVEEPLIGSPSGVVCPDCQARASYGALVHNVVSDPESDDDG